MSSDNVETNRRLLAAYNARDVEGMLEAFDPNIELESAFAAVDGAIYRGHAGIRRWHADLADAWGPEVRLEPEVYFDLGDRTLAFYVLHGRGERSGLEVTMTAAYIVRWRDGRAIHLKAYAERSEALRALGLSEDDLEPIAP